MTPMLKAAMVQLGRSTRTLTGEGTDAEIWAATSDAQRARSFESVEAIVGAYLTALSEDEGTVEAMAESFRAAPSMSYEDAARYFLRTLATKEPT